MTALDGYELVTVLDAPHDLKALLYRRLPTPPPADPWDVDSDPPPWLQDELPAGLEDLAERVQRLSPEAEQALSGFSPAQRSALGL